MYLQSSFDFFSMDLLFNPTGKNTHTHIRTKCMESKGTENIKYVIRKMKGFYVVFKDFHKIHILHKSEL